MKSASLKLSLLSTAVMLSLAGCGGSSSSNKNTVAVDNAPAVSDYAIDAPKQWLPVTGYLPATDKDGDAITFSFSENGQAVTAENGVFKFSHGTLTLDGNNFTYTSLTGADAVVDFTATANGKSATAKLTISNVVGDPLANQQWHLRNTGQKAYALSDSMKQGLIDLYVGRGETEEEATAKVNGWFEEEEARLIPGEDMNVVAAYAQGVTGEGVIAVVADSGMELRHEDLEPNVLVNRSLNLNEDALDKTDPTSTANSGDHGTSVAGLIAAKGWNGLGGHGVAPNAKLIGMNYLGSGKVAQTDFLAHGFPGSGISKSDEVVVFNRSYGIDFPVFFGYSELDEAIEMYPTMLRNGKGAVSMKSSGNSFEDGRNEGTVCSDNGANSLGLTCYNGSSEPSQNHPYYLSVAAVDVDGRHTSYSTGGASLFVSAPSGEYGRYSPAMVTTDQMTCLSGYSGFTGSAIAAWTQAYGEDFVKSQFPFNYPGHEDNASCNYTSTFNGTSSAAPNASGVVALIASANPALTWRDIRHILASTSTKVMPNDEAINLTIGEDSFVAHDGWTTNAAGFHFNDMYGFGRVNAGAAVAMAKAYNVNLGEMQVTEWIGQGTAAGQDALTTQVPDNSAAGAEFTINVEQEMALEAMQFKFDISNPDMGLGLADGTQTTAGMDLAIEVTSPAGTRAVLLASKQAIIAPAYKFGEGFANGYILKDAVILANAFYGESTKGDWKIKVLDTSDASFVATDGGDNFGGFTGYTNNAQPSVVEGVALRAYGHSAQ